MNGGETSERRVAIVFGGSRGIGAAVALRLAEEGYSLAITYVSSPGKADEVVAAIGKAGGEAMAIHADSADPAALLEAVAAVVGRWGPISVAVVNAGVLRLGRIADLSLADLDLTLDVNVRGVVLAVQAAAAHMRDGGRIITIGSNTAIRAGGAGSSIYSMSKAAVAAFVKGAALDFAPRHITVNNIQPGPTETDMTAEAIPQLVGRIPLGRVGQPWEIAALASYLASDASGYMTGASLTIDGGFIL